MRTLQFLHPIKNGIILLPFCLFPLLSPGQTISFARNSKTVVRQEPDKQPKYRQLSEVLKELEDHYQVAFVHSSGLTTGKVVGVETSLYKYKLEGTLQRLLAPLGLKFSKIGDRSYVIFVNKIKPAPLDKPVEETVPVRKPVENPSSFLTEPANSPESPPVSIAFTVSGRVNDEAGNVLPGATVLLKGSTNVGTATNADGRFVLTLPDGMGILVVSSIGYTPKEVPVNNRATIDINLVPDVKLLNEIVVVGYGTQQKKDLTGAIASVNSKQIQEVVATNAVQAIQGRVPGVTISQNNWNPGAEATVRVRGTRSFRASNDPLYVIDGIPIARGLNEINPSDIESMEVLKDASATAIYGSRGANGVILITTKRGKSGKTSVNYDGYAGIQQPLRQLDIMNGGQYAEFVREAYRNRTAAPYASPTPTQAEDKKLVIFTQDPYVLESVMMGYDDQGNYNPNNVRSFNWVDAVMRQGSIQNHQLSVSGGTEKTKALFSGSYFGNKGLLKNQDYNRYSIRLNLDHSLSQNVKIGASSVVSSVLENAGSNLYGTARQQNPLATPYASDGSLLLNPGNDNLAVNPLLDIEGIINEHRRNRVITSLFLEAKIVDGLRYRANFGYDYRTARDGRYQNVRSSPRNGSSSWAEYGGNNAKGFTLENLLFYDRSFGDKHKVSVTALQSIQTDRFEENLATVEGLPYDYQKFYNIGSATTGLGVRSNLTEWKMLSWMGRLNYSFAGKYLLTVSGRSDGSSVLAAGRKYAFFPSAAFAWRISDEPFMKTVSYVDDLKLRIGYGRTGNSSISPYQTQGSLTLLRYAWDEKVALGYVPSGIPNSRLSWETTGQINLGLDFSLFKGRVSGSIDMYRQDTKDLLMDRQLPIVSGFGNILENIGQTRNKGLEIGVSSINLDNKRGFTWSTDVVFSRNREEIVQLYGGAQSDIGNTWFIGQPISVYYDHQFEGIWQNSDSDKAEMAKFNANGHNYTPGLIRLKDQNGDYKINAEDRIILGNNRPKWTGSLSNNLSYKNFDLAFQWYASWGAMAFFDKALRLEGRWNTVNVNYWTPTNGSNEYPKSSTNWETPPDVGTLYYQDGSFLRLKFLTIGYNLPKELVNRLKLNKVRVYFSAQNPYLYTKFDGLDPEGAQGFAAPSPKTFMGGLSIGL
ncbi:SusC/RagA family TonB-linked outer membrane protein [Larkinella bovis]|uniref:SusC/RagA family TonB-linked outer membrane protein n=1 Tax=Larkinella bovis TaxID=683041 RepID=A0ABW0IBM5_9BACT